MTESAIQFVPLEFSVKHNLEARSLGTNIRERLERSLIETYAGHCFQGVYIRTGSLTLKHKTIGQLVGSHFRGQITYYAIFQADAYKPVIGSTVAVKVISINESGIMAQAHPLEVPMKVFLAKTQHAEMIEEFNRITINDVLSVKLMDYEILYDYIYAVGYVERADKATFDREYLIKVSRPYPVLPDVNPVATSEQVPLTETLGTLRQSLFEKYDQINTLDQKTVAEISEQIAPYRQLAQIPLDPPALDVEQYYNMWEILKRFELVKNTDQITAYVIGSTSGAYLQALINYRQPATNKGDKIYGLAVEPSVQPETAPVPAEPKSWAEREEEEEIVPESEAVPVQPSVQPKVEPEPKVERSWEEQFRKDYYDKITKSDALVVKTSSYPSSDSLLTVTSNEVELSDPAWIDPAHAPDLIIACAEPTGEFSLTDAEQYYQALLFAEIFRSIATQRHKGVLVIRFDDIFTHMTGELIAVLTNYYEVVKIYKPEASRPDSSERFIVAKYFKFWSEEQISRNAFKQLGDTILKQWQVFNTVFNFDLKSDNEFIDSVQNVVSQLVEVQKIQLQQIINYATGVTQMDKEAVQTRQRNYATKWIERYLTETPVGSDSLRSAKPVIESKNAPPEKSLARPTFQPRKTPVQPVTEPVPVPVPVQVPVQEPVVPKKVMAPVSIKKPTVSVPAPVQVAPAPVSVSSVVPPTESVPPPVSGVVPPTVQTQAQPVGTTPAPAKKPVARPRPKPVT